MTKSVPKVKSFILSRKSEDGRGQFEAGRIIFLTLADS
jgi:hypothetical protein